MEWGLKVGGRARGRNSVSITRHRIWAVKAGPGREEIFFLVDTSL